MCITCAFLRICRPKVIMTDFKKLQHAYLNLKKERRFRGRAGGRAGGGWEYILIKGIQFKVCILSLQ